MAILGAMGGMMSAASSNKATKQNAKNVADTNAANLQIAKETNAANRQIASDNNAANLALAREQNSYNESMWRKQNEYNSPSAQLHRNEAAGINGLASIENVPASSLQSADLANQTTGAPMQGATMQAAQASPTDYNSIMQGVLAAKQADNVQANTDKIKKETSWIDDLNGRAISLSDAQIEAQKLVNNFERLSQPLRFNAMRLDNDYKEVTNRTAKVLKEQADERLKQMKFETKTMVESFQKNMRALDDAHDISELNKIGMGIDNRWKPLVYGSEVNSNNASARAVNASAYIDEENGKVLPQENKLKLGQMKYLAKQQLVDFYSQGYQPLKQFLSSGKNLEIIGYLSKTPERKWSDSQFILWNEYCDLQKTALDRANDAAWQQTAVGRNVMSISDGFKAVMTGVGAGLGAGSVKGGLFKPRVKSTIVIPK